MAVTIPILLVAEEGWPERLLCNFIEILAQVNVVEIVRARGDVGPPTDVAIVDMRAGGPREVVIAALLLRNEGRTAIICARERIPKDLVSEAASVSVLARREGRPVRTEVLLTEEAMNYLGDVSGIVRYFEQEFLA